MRISDGTYDRRELIPFKVALSITFANETALVGCLVIASVALGMLFSMRAGRTDIQFLNLGIGEQVV